MNIVHRVTNVQITDTALKHVTAKTTENVVSMANVLLPAAPRNAFQT